MKSRTPSALGNTMTEGKPYLHILRFTAPLLLGMLLQQLYNTVDTIIVGRFSGEAALSATGTSGTFIYFFVAMAIGFSAGNGVVVAQHYGARDEKAVRENASTGILLLCGMGLLLTLVAIGISRVAFRDLIAVPEDILPQALTYFRLYAVGFLFHYAYNIFAAILRAVGDSAATMYFLLIASVSNIFLDLLFVGAFHWGVAGAAIATTIAQMGCCIAAYVYMVRRYPVFRFRLKEFTFSWRLAAVTLKVGLPISLQQMVVSFGLTLIQRAVNGFGTTMVASFTVGNRIEMYINIPCNAFQTAMATYTGQNVGARKMDRVKQGARQTILMSFVFTVLISLMVILLRDPIIRLFSISEEAMVYCRQHLTAVALVNVILSLYVPLFGLYQGTNHAAVPTICATCALTTRVLVTYLFRYSSFFGYTIIWWNGLFGFCVALTIAWVIYLSGLWKRNVFVDEEETA